MPGLLTKKWKCKQRIWVTGKTRTKHDKIKLMTYMQYIQKSWREEKEKNKKIDMYQLHNNKIIHTPISSFVKLADSCSTLKGRKIQQSFCLCLLNNCGNKTYNL